MNLIDKIQVPSVCDFVRGQLEPYDLSRLEWFKFLPLQSTSRFHGYCRWPKRLKKYSRKFTNQYQINCSINVSGVWPGVVEMTVGTWQKGELWGYDYRTETISSLREACVFIAGHEVYHFLRHSGQIRGRTKKKMVYTQFQMTALYMSIQVDTQK